MDVLIFALLSYFATGIVFITWEADQQLNEAVSSLPRLQHPLLRLTAGMIMIMLWPVFMLGEVFESQQSPMAIKIDVKALK